MKKTRNKNIVFTKVYKQRDMLGIKYLLTWLMVTPNDSHKLPSLVDAQIALSYSSSMAYIILISTKELPHPQVFPIRNRCFPGRHHDNLHSILEYGLPLPVGDEGFQLFMSKRSRSHKFASSPIRSFAIEVKAFTYLEKNTTLRNAFESQSSGLPSLGASLFLLYHGWEEFSIVPLKPRRSLLQFGPTMAVKVKAGISSNHCSHFLNIMKLFSDHCSYAICIPKGHQASGWICFLNQHLHYPWPQNVFI